MQPGGQGLGIEEIDRKYEVLKKLGEGGMGAVYQVHHRLLEEIRVIKMIRSELKGDDELQARFLSEAKVATQLRHPNIAQMFDFSIGDDATAYIVMEFIDGKTLEQLFKEHGKLSLGTVFALADQCLDALSYLHKKRIVHRDISPDNIMLVEDGSGGLQIKLIDLGIAKHLESTHMKTSTGVFVGKIKYAAPEALSGDPERKVEARSDLYSLGLVIYEALTATFAVTGTDQMSIIAGHLLNPPRSFEESDPEGRVPEQLRKVVLKSLEKAAERRFSSAEEFRRALRDAAGPGGALTLEDEDEYPTVILDRGVPAATSSDSATDQTQWTDGKKKASWLSSLGRVGGRRRLIVTLSGLALVAAVAWWAMSGGLGRLPSDRAAPGSGTELSPRADGRNGLPAASLAGLDYGNYHALVIGNNSYEQLPRLETAAIDARDFAELLERKYDFDVTLLTDATRYEIISALTDIAGSMTARDNLLVYYAGHGWLDAQSQTAYWQPVDAEAFSTANWISTKYEVSAVLGNIPARQVLVVADSCYSGAISESIDSTPLPDLSSADYPDQVREILQRRSRLALTSGGLSPVLDVGDGRHSVFSKVLLETLDSNTQVVETSRIFSEIKTRVSEAAAQFGVDQDPQLAPIPQSGDEGGDFFFVPAAAAS